MKGKIVLGLLFMAMVFTFGCTQYGATQNSPADSGGAAAGGGSMDKSGAVMEKDGGSLEQGGGAAAGEGGSGDAMDTGDAMAGDVAAMQKSFYIPFTKAEYEKAKAEGKVIWLEFYANWCPTCAQQKPVNEKTFASAEMPSGVAGFQVNFNDSDTDVDEIALAREFGITYQHTRVVLGAEGNIVSKSTGFVGPEGIVAMAEKALGA